MAPLVLAGPDRSGQCRVDFDFAVDSSEMLATLADGEKKNPAASQNCYKLLKV
jgi:hypothetical protein